MAKGKTANVDSEAQSLLSNDIHRDWKAYRAIQADDNVAIADQSADPSLKVPQGQRIVALDLLRGLIMILESIDHAKLFLTTWYGPHEVWYELPSYTSSFQFLLRLATHPCFAFLMGIGVVYFIRSRKRLGWEDSKLLRHFAIRGALLVFLNMVQTYNWSGSRWMGAESKFATTVLVALGVNFFLSAVVAIASNHAYSAALKKLETRARRRVASGRSSIPDIEGAATRVKLLRIVGLLLLVFALVTLNLLLVPKPTPNGTGFAWWKYMIYLPGQASFFFSIYPPLNWLGLSLYGVAFGYIMLGRKRGPMENISLNVLCGVIFTIAFVVVRVIGGFGNVNPDLLPAPPAGTFLNNPFLTNWQTFFNTIKYPPDYAYSSLYMAINHFSLAAFFLLPTDVVKDTASEGESGSTTVAKLRNCAQYSIGFITGGPLYDYGRCALFFYIIHLPLYGILGWITLQISPESWTVDDGKGGKLLALEKPGFFSVWIVGLFILWALCRWYAGFKARRGPDSVFRFF